LNRRVAAGDVRYIGCSNWRPERIRKAQKYAEEHGLAPFIADELEWSAARRLAPDTAVDPLLPWMTDEAMEYHKATKMTAFAFTSMASGFFQKLENGGAEGLHEQMRRAFLRQETIRCLDRIRKLRADGGYTTAQILMGYIRGQKHFTGIPIAFGRSEQQMQELLEAADAVLTAEEIAFLLDGKE